jgi:hypothetical protein
MKKLFYAGLAGLAVFEILHVYFIMPMPGSQRMDSLALAYLLHSWRWAFRVFFAAMLLAGAGRVFGGKRKWLPALALLPAGLVVYWFNFGMAAEKMFRQPQNLRMKPQEENAVPGDRLVIGVEHNGMAKAYPIAFIAYHHQVRDTVGDRPVMVTYCSVCRTGRVYEPAVNGKAEAFRLVGMDRFNAMFEDAATKSWWYQATGQAVAGPLKGSRLPEIPSLQMSLNEWFGFHPEGLVMQADPAFLEQYDSLARFEKGLSRSELTRTDTARWAEKSWVVGLRSGPYRKAYAWADLVSEKIIHDTLGPVPVLLVLPAGMQAFAAFERPQGSRFELHQDTLYSDSLAYDSSGRRIGAAGNNLKPVQAYQEFWHSWRTFNPGTTRYRSVPLSP